MKKLLFCVLWILPCLMYAQFGVKAGLNFANVTNASTVNSSTNTGYHVGIFLAGSSKSLLSSLTELQYSRQGYNFETSTNTGTVNLDYLILPQFLAINITKFVQVQAGAYVAYLLNAEVDSTSISTGNSSTDDILALYNRLDYGLGGGVEIHPLYALVIGARIHFSLGPLYNEPEPGESYPNFFPDIDTKNNLFQLYAGFKFGKEKSDPK